MNLDWNHDTIQSRLEKNTKQITLKTQCTFVDMGLRWDNGRCLAKKSPNLGEMMGIMGDAWPRNHPTYVGIYPSLLSAIYPSLLSAMRCLPPRCSQMMLPDDAPRCSQVLPIMLLLVNGFFTIGTQNRDLGALLPGNDSYGRPAPFLFS